MYHIKPDARCYKSVNKLCAAMDTIIKKKSFDEITVSDLLRLSGIGRATFYRNFDTVDDVVIYMVETEFQDALGEMEVSTNTELLRFLLQFFMNKKTQLENIIVSGRSFLLMDTFRECIRRTNMFRESEDKKMAEYSISIYSGMVLSALMVWYSNGCKESKEELCTIVEKSVDLIARAVIDSDTKGETVYSAAIEERKRS